VSSLLIPSLMEVTNLINDAVVPSFSTQAYWHLAGALNCFLSFIDCSKNDLPSSSSVCHSTCTVAGEPSSDVAYARHIST
jgi:hypothetical protein